ncbi:MAG: DNA cytosine methyltransferase [Acetobacter sp.]|uniref:DNA cytosine methyltransferase n=1 Tax=Acetobacter sp. TaxID=440 RepID=UPI0039E8B68D
MPFYGSGSGETGRALDRPIGTITRLDRWAVVRGDDMRMLQPTELRAIMGFPGKYVLPPAQRPAIQLLGNAVVPWLAADVIRALEAA